MLTPLCFLVLTGLACSVQARIIYVRNDALGANDGSNWTNAMTNLQSAIDAANTGDTLCVATGLYLPAFKLIADNDRSQTFYIDKDIAIFGGFLGLPGTEGNLSIRNANLFPTTLSGDLGIEADTLDNAFHVVYLDHVSTTMTLDGFIIRDGNNFGASGFEAYGAGVYMEADSGTCSPVIVNCIIRDNHASESGGGIAVFAPFGGVAKPKFIGCHIFNNEGSGGGGLQYYTDTDGTVSPELIGCFFQGNTARTASGSAVSGIVHSSNSVPLVVNSVFTGNHSNTSAAYEVFLTGTGLTMTQIINSVFAGNNHGSLRISSIGSKTSNVIVRNSIFWNNGFGHGLTTNNADADVTNSIMENGFTGDANLFDDPLFVIEPSAEGTPHLNGDVHLQPGSPAIDAGNNGSIPVEFTVDAEGHPRMIDVQTGEIGGIIDIGAFEVQEAITSIAPMHSALAWNVYPNPVMDNIHIEIPVSGNTVQLVLWSADGRLIYRQEINEANRHIEIPVAGIVPGVYNLAVVSNGVADARRIVVCR